MLYTLPTGAIFPSPFAIGTLDLQPGDIIVGTDSFDIVEKVVATEHDRRSTTGTVVQVMVRTGFTDGRKGHGTAPAAVIGYFYAGTKATHTNVLRSNHWSQVPASG